MHYLSKSKLISGWQCAKRLWLEKYAPDEKEFSASTEAAFAVGHQVGGAAQTQFPGGILIEHDKELSQALRETQELLAKPGPITLFEATFQADGVLIRADVLIRNDADQLHLIEVKASTSVKDYHLNDCAIQLWVLEQLGLKVVRVDLAHINNQFVYPGDGNYDGLFTYENVTEQARTLQPGVPKHVAAMRAVLDAAEPDISMGKQCTKPFECPYINYCKGPQAEMPVSWLPGGRTLHARLEQAGYRDIREIPVGYLSSETAEWCRQVSVAGEPDLNPAAAKELNQLGWPRYYFDFETLGPAVPVFAGTRPYQAQPFQWSCHIEHEGGEIDHKEFLDDGENPPMRACAEALLAALGDSGPVFMYTSYEDGVLKNLISLYTDLAMPLEAIRKRLMDLHPLTKNNYYHPDMHGSWSIKAVLPTVAPNLSYIDLETVTVGTEAGEAFLEMIDEKTSKEKAAELKKALLRYCELDTEAMVRLARYLEQRLPEIS